MDSSSATVAITTSIIISIIAMIVVIYTIDSPAKSFMIPFIAYVLTVIMSAIYQYSMCHTVNIGSIAISNLYVLLCLGAATTILFLETLPLMKYIFGESTTINKTTGLPYQENDYKIQFFSSIVRSVVPAYVQDSTRQGFVYLYWTFWLTLLPYYFVLSVQGFCI